MVLLVVLPGNREIGRAGDLEPREFSEFGDGDSLDGVVHEQFGDQIAGSFGEERRQTVEAV